jgi:hypothetical protein
MITAQSGFAWFARFAMMLGEQLGDLLLVDDLACAGVRGE